MNLQSLRGVGRLILFSKRTPNHVERVTPQLIQQQLCQSWQPPKKYAQHQEFHLDDHWRMNPCTKTAATLVNIPRILILIIILIQLRGNAACLPRWLPNRLPACNHLGELPPGQLIAQGNPGSWISSGWVVMQCLPRGDYNKMLKLGLTVG